MIRTIILLFFATLIFGTSYAEPTEHIYLSGIDFEHPAEWDFM